MLVEGTDDYRLIERLMRFAAIEADVNVYDMGGNRTGWSTHLQAIAEDPLFKLNVRRIALVMDADLDASAAFQSCANAIRSIAFPVPVRAGEVATAGDLQSSIWIMPGNAPVGALEDLLLGTAEQRRLEASEKYLEDLNEAGLAGPKSRQKGVVQVYMGGSEESPKTLNVALRNDLWNLGAESLNEFKQWLSSALTAVAPESDGVA